MLLMVLREVTQMIVNQKGCTCLLWSANRNLTSQYQKKRKKSQWLRVTKSSLSFSQNLVRVVCRKDLRTLLVGALIRHLLYWTITVSSRKRCQVMKVTIWLYLTWGQEIQLIIQMRLQIYLISLQALFQIKKHFNLLMRIKFCSLRLNKKRKK